MQLNMMLLLSFERTAAGVIRNGEDIMKIFRRFDSFRSMIVKKGEVPSHKDYGGLRLNMREFYRALVIGTSKTKRRKNIGTQVEPLTKNVNTQTEPNAFLNDSEDLKIWVRPLDNRDVSSSNESEDLGVQMETFLRTHK